MRPRVFIGSSNEAIGVANALQAFLEDASNYSPHTAEHGLPEVRVWKDAGIFQLAEMAKESLVKATLEYDFAVMIFSGEDTSTVREVQTPAPRDNVVFEAGLFAGALGFDRMFIVTPRGIPVRIPSDLAGFTRTTYLQREDGTVNVNVAGNAIIAAIRNHGVMWHENIEPKIRELVSHARSAYNIRHAVFHDYLEGWCNRNLEQSRSWPEGAMRIENDTGPWLANVYSQAQKNIFSTSIPSFMPIWRSKLGKQLLRAQVESGRSSTRVFIFPNERSVKAADKATMEEHRNAGIEVRTFFDRAVNSFDWNPGEIETDFIFIDDGDVIGVTEDVKKYRSRWYFKNSQKKKEYTRHKKSLMSFSDPL